MNTPEPKEAGTPEGSSTSSEGSRTSKELSRRKFLSRGAATAGAVAVAGVAGPGLLSGGSPFGGMTSAAAATSSKPGVGTGKPKKGGTAIIGTTADIDGFYPPSNHWDVNGYCYANAIYDPLTAVAADGSIQPYLAQSVTPNADKTVWNITLRPDVTFSDGSALTATVLKNNLDALKASALTGTALQPIESFDVTGPLSVAATCSQPVVAFPYYLATQVGYIVGQAMIDGSSNSTPPKPVGTGPFVYSSWNPNDHFTATRNPHYWRSGYPYLDQITFKPIPDTSQREATLKAGGVDMILSIDPNTVDHFQNQSAYQVVDTLTQKVGEPDMDYIMLNCLAPPTNDLGIRQALAKGMNGPTLNKIFGGGLVQISNSPFPKGSPYYSPTAYPSFDPAGAKKLVAAYTKAHGKPTIELVTIPDPRLTRLTQVLQQMWQSVGFTINLKTIEQAELISNAITGNFQAYTFEQFAAGDPDINYVWWSTTTVAPVGGIALNFARNSDSQIEAALQVGRSSSNQADRAKAYQQVGQRLGVDLPYLWLGATIWSEVADQRIQNFANPKLPNGSPGKPFDNGVFFPTQIWMAG
jgi:peptide/nickel transport system substrate-binding protein